MGLCEPLASEVPWCPRSISRVTCLGSAPSTSVPLLLLWLTCTWLRTQLSLVCWVCVFGMVLYPLSCPVSPDFPMWGASSLPPHHSCHVSAISAPLHPSTFSSSLSPVCLRKRLAQLCTRAAGREPAPASGRSPAAPRGCLCCVGLAPRVFSRCRWMGRSVLSASLLLIRNLHSICTDTLSRNVPFFSGSFKVFQHCSLSSVLAASDASGY